MTLNGVMAVAMRNFIEFGSFLGAYVKEVTIVRYTDNLCRSIFIAIFAKVTENECIMYGRLHVTGCHHIQYYLLTATFKFNCKSDFYSASALLAMQSAVLARGILTVCLSVHPSRSGIVSRRMKIRSCGFQHLVGQSL